MRKSIRGMNKNKSRAIIKLADRGAVCFWLNSPKDLRKIYKKFFALAGRPNDKSIQRYIDKYTSPIYLLDKAVVNG